MHYQQEVYTQISDSDLKIVDMYAGVDLDTTIVSPESLPITGVYTE